MPDFDGDGQTDDYEDGLDGEESNDLDLDTDENEDAEDGDTGSASGSDDKSVKALQSARDKETARANKLQKQLDQYLARGEASADGRSATASPEVEAMREDLREAALDAAFAEFGELKEYGISRALVDGYSRAEVRENSQALVALVKSVATKARNKTLADAGLKADPSGTSRSKPVDYASMSSEEFNKLVDGVG